MLKAFNIFTGIFTFIVLGFWLLLMLQGRIHINQGLSANEADVTVLVFDGDKIYNEFMLKDKFIFLLKKDGLFYADTAQPGFFRADYSNLSMLGAGHRKIIQRHIKIDVDKENP